MRFTQGPWRAEDHGGWYTVRDRRNIHVVTVEPFDAAVGADVEGNARLIAAAPDMLEVCAAVVAGWHADAHNFLRPEPRHVEQARQAIAKATNMTPAEFLAARTPA